LLKVKGLDSGHLQGNQNSSGLQFEVAYWPPWPAMTTGGAAQVLATHCLNERALDPAVCSQTDPPVCQ